MARTGRIIFIGLRQVHIGLHEDYIGLHEDYIGLHEVFIGLHEIFIDFYEVYIGPHEVFIGLHGVSSIIFIGFQEIYIGLPETTQDLRWFIGFCENLVYSTLWIQTWALHLGKIWSSVTQSLDASRLQTRWIWYACVCKHGFGMLASTSAVNLVCFVSFANALDLVCLRLQTSWIQYACVCKRVGFGMPAFANTLDSVCLRLQTRWIWYACVCKLGFSMPA